MKFRRRQVAEVNVNLTPMIDVVFLMLIFFMVSTSFTKETELVIDLPQATGQPRAVIDEEIEILIDEQGQARVNGLTLVDQSVKSIQAAVYKVSGGNRQLPLRISADAQAPHNAVVKAMDAVGQMGFVHLSIASQRPPDKAH